MKEMIIDMHDKMYNLTVNVADVKSEIYQSVLLDMVEFTENDFKGLYDWLTYYKDHEYRELKDVYDLLPDKTWKDYKIFNITGLREQQMLKDASKAVKRYWSKPFRSEKQLARKKSRKAVIKHKPVD